MKEVTLSERLKTVAAFLPAGSCFADIGSDHAYLPSYVCMNDAKAMAIAGEINEGPFLSAEKTVRELNLEERIGVRKGNGLEVLNPFEVKQVVIAGMGGSLISAILEEGKDKLDGVDVLILQPNVDAKAVRIWLSHNGYALFGEKIMEEGNHIYEVIAAEKSKDARSMTEKELLFGPSLLQERSLPFRKKWAREVKNIERILNEMEKAKETNQEKINQFKREKEWIKEVLGID